MTKLRTATLAEFIEIRTIRHYGQDINAVEHVRHPCGQCFIPVKLSTDEEALLAGHVLQLRVRDVEDILSMAAEVVLMLLPMGVILYDTRDEDTRLAISKNFPPGAYKETVSDALIRHCRILTTAMKESADPWIPFERMACPGPPIVKMTVAQKQKAHNACNALIGRLFDKIEVRRQVLNTSCCDMQFADFLEDTKATTPALPPSPLFADEAMVSAGNLAELLKLDTKGKNALQQKLKRWRRENGDGWQEVQNPPKNAPKYLYSYGAVKHLRIDPKASQPHHS